MNERVASIMTRELITVNQDDSLQKVKDILINNRIHHVPVVDGKKLVGLVTTYDLFKLNVEHKDYPNTRVGNVMTKRIATVESNFHIGTAAEVFMEHLFHAIPVVDNGELVGIVTSFDILKYEYHKEYPRG
ncbi:MAG: CBS domain-containing protein [Saprospiraceae bacterium]|uniref:CBS domain-containing protein n=1 Tax=Candidatus Defluviibacterium haderslevense TaxID=2981993 RepID=A0A9D7S9M1_9BACT|nr:CBS domain-containing protein [Candidatus Defluviibacterium haderslevense]MBK9717667.1 CBS domain-containing protein [Candidatus Defluviibacterium haderslevense]MBL0237410.1 CBS domain-containing protein [Candidatus Defluviibacterium haderslevense]